MMPTLPPRPPPHAAPVPDNPGAPLHRSLYLLAFVQGPVLATVRPPFGAGEVQISAVLMSVLVCAPIFAFKQMTNVLQMLIAFEAINAFEREKAGGKGH